MAAHKVSNQYLHIFAKPGSPMKRLVSRTLLLVSAGVGSLAAVFFLYPSSVLARNDTPPVIEVTAKKYQYLPGPIHVKRGARIELKITAIDHDHGFSISEVPDGADSNGSAG